MINVAVTEQICPLCLEPTQDCLGRTPPFHRDYYQCGACGLIFTPKEFHLPRKEERQRYDLHNNIPEDPRYRQFLSKLTTPLSRHIKPGWQGLDFGCGPGPAIGSLLQDAEVTVKNYDPFYHPDKKLLDKKYDFITCSEVVEHFYEPRQEFQRLNGLLKNQDSVLGVMTEIWRGQGRFLDWWYQKDPAHVSFYSDKTFSWISGWLGWERVGTFENALIFKKAKT